MRSKFLKHCGLVWLLGAQVLAWTQPAGASARPASFISKATEKNILNEPGVPILGSVDADITVVEYFDYNCPFCRALAPAFHPFIQQDRAAAVLYKEWPIFGGVSVYAAQAALAANYQGKYLQAHDALISAPRLEESSQVDAVLRNVGIDVPRLKKDLETHRASIEGLLARNDTEARSMGLHGTPGILVGRRIVSGIADLHTLQSVVAQARGAGTK